MTTAERVEVARVIRRAQSTSAAPKDRVVNSQGEERAARPGRVFTWKDAKELAGTVLALCLAGLLIGIFYYAQLAGHIG